MKLGGNMKAKKLAALVLAGALCLSAFTGCGIDASKTVATLGEQEVSLGVVNFMCKYQKSSYDDVYSGYFGEDFWSQDLYGSGTTMEDSLKTNVMSTLHAICTLKANMEKYGVTLSDEEKTAITEAAEAFMKDNSKEAIKEMGATKEIVEEVLTLYTIQWKVYEAIIKDVDREVSDEDGNMRGISYIKIRTDGYYNSSNTLVKYSDEEKAKLLETAKKMETALESDKLEDVAKEYDYTVTEDAYVKDDEGFDDDLLKAMDALKEGEVSKLIEVKDAIYFVRIDADIDEEATKENVESIIAERESELYSETLEELQKNDGWTVNEDVLDQIDFHNLITLKDPNSTETESSKDTESTEGTESTEVTERTEGTESTEGTETEGTESTEK